MNYLNKNTIDPSFLEELKTFPNQPAIWSMMNGSNPGTIKLLSDEKSIVLIENTSEPLVYIAGQFREQQLSELLALCPNDAFLYCNPKYHHLFITHGWQIFHRAQLSYSAPIIKPIKCEWIIRPINDIEFFKQCSDFQSMSERFGSAENFLQHGKGYALCNDQQIIAEIYTAYYGDNEIDISIITHPDFRGCGVGSQIASYFAELCTKDMITPIWSCFTLNEASLRTALSVGFRIEQYYVLLMRKD